MTRHSRIRFGITLGLAGLYALSAGPAAAQPRAKQPARAAAPSLQKGIEARTLKNGMRVVVAPDHDVPNVSLYTHYRVGSRNERPGITGISHFFEHMMFHGSKEYPSGAFDRIMENAGGSNNAYTSTDVTVYQDWIPKSALETVLRMEADRICCLQIDSTSVESERGVIASERRTTTDDNNEAFLDEQAQAIAFTAHPYQIPIIGWPSDIERWTVADLREYHRTYYAPNNAVLVVSGDVTPAEFFALAERILEPIPAQAPPPAVRTVEPPQLGERRFVVRRPGQIPYIQAVFHRGRANDSDAEALDLLSTILTGGESSRLYRRLVDEDRVAVAVYDYMLEGFDPGLYRILVTVSPAAGIEACEKALLDELARVGREGVTEAELKKAKNVELANFWRRMATIDGKAAMLGDAEVFRGDWKAAFSAPERYGRVTAKEIQTLARRLFDEKNRTIGLLVPENEPVAATEKGGAR
ncbi:MAG TPA: pitrilysin family protein [Candidatus Eisenbacteria bacterium]|nr:pitrilysin family protein [Candidatus Eisenbacteria bacterium]